MNEKLVCPENSAIGENRHQVAAGTWLPDPGYKAFVLDIRSNRNCELLYLPSFFQMLPRK